MPLSFGEDSLSSYSAQISQKIVNGIREGRFPRMIVPRGKIRTVLDISILPSGKIYLIKIVESSGIEEFDQEAKNFVRELAPYPPLPESRQTRLEMRVPIEVVGEENKDNVKLKQKAKGEPEAEINKPPAAKSKNKIDDNKEERKKKIELDVFMGDFSKEKEKIAQIADESKRLYKVALDNSDPAKVARQQLGLAQLKINEAGRNLFPQMELQYSLSEGDTITDPYRSKAYALQLRQNLFDDGKTFKTLRKEKLNLEVAENEYEKTVQDLKFEIIQSYFNVLGKQEELEEMETFSAEVSKDYHLAEEIYKAGAISKIDFVEIEAEYQRTSNMIDQINNELQLASEKLRASMNLAPHEDVPLQEKFLPKLGEIDINVDECINLALANKPDVKLWEISLKSSEYAKNIAGSESAPRLDLVSSYGASGEAYSTQPLDLAEEWKLMGVVTWLFGGNSLEVSAGGDRVGSKAITDVSRKTTSNTYSTKVGVMDKMQYYVQKKEADIAYSQNLSNLAKNKQEVVFDTRKSFLEYRQSFDEYRVALFEDKFSRVNLELKKESSKIGQASLSEVAKSRADYMRKRLSLIRAKTSYFISLAGLDKAAGFGLGVF